MTRCDYVRQRVAESCADQGLTVAPPVEIVEAAAAVLAFADGGQLRVRERGAA